MEKCNELVINGITYVPKAEERGDMKIVVFECYLNNYKETFAFADSATEEDITEEFKRWIWNEFGDRFGWRVKE